MKNVFFGCLGIITLILISCNNQNNKNENANADNIVLQQEDGTVILKLDNAECYSNEVDPSSNTAEWNVAISNPGRYKIWISSATKDTLDLNYTHKIKVNLQDSQLDVKPEYSKIIQNSEDVKYPYFQADSYMGTFYISEPGEYIIQIISELIVSEGPRAQISAVTEGIKLMSLVLTPSTR